jgi:signal transduction histidine kinase
LNETAEAIRVMVVDDEQDIRDGSERILSRAGFRVLTAGNGEAALTTLEASPADIVLLDLKMPGMDGLEVLDRIRKRDPSVLVIVITGFATVETAIAAMKRGAYDFIAKPFDPDQLRIGVNRAAEKMRLSRERERLEKDRRRTLLDLDTEKSRLRSILEVLPNGVLVTNAEGQVVLMNMSFRRHLGLENEVGPGEPLDRCVPDPELCRLMSDISRGCYVDFEDIPAVEFSPFEGRYLQARGQPVLGEKNECLGAVLNIVDISGLKALDQLKSDFIAKVSHELRSPLATIHEQLAHVLTDMVDEVYKNDQHILARAKEKTAGLISLIGDLLDLSRIEEGAICNEPRTVQLDRQLQDVVGFLESRAGSKKQRLELELPADPLPAVTADPIAIESIFGNLITNAIHYTPEGGVIRVLCERTGPNVRVRVVDNGFGIEARHLDKIFERFYRVKNDKTRYITGTGLGLPIVKGLVKGLGGRIQVESTPGQGSTFEVLLPLTGGASPPE